MPHVAKTYIRIARLRHALAATLRDRLVCGHLQHRAECLAYPNPVRVGDFAGAIYGCP